MAVTRQFDLQDSRVVDGHAIVDLHVIAFLNRLYQVSVVVSDKHAACLIFKNEHELVHVYDLALDVNTPHAVANVFNSHRIELQGCRLGTARRGQEALVLPFLLFLLSWVAFSSPIPVTAFQSIHHRKPAYTMQRDTR